MPGNILISGANRGIGLEITRQLAAKGGYHVYAGCRQPDAAKELKELASSTGNVTPIKLDVTCDKDIHAAVETVSKAVGASGLQVLLNNAGILNDSGKMLEGVKRADINEVLNVNCTSQLIMAQAFRQLLGKGSTASASVIVNITSEMGSIANASTGSYGYRASKTALNMVTKALANELHPEGIYCIAVHPGWVETDMGGAKAPTKPSDSAAGIISVIENIKEAQNGTFIDYQGNPRLY